MNAQTETIRNEKELEFLDLTKEFYYRLKVQKEKYHKRLQTAKDIGDYSLAAKMQERIMGMGKAKKIFKSSKNVLKDEYYKKLKGEK
jgi:hypothetical protein